MKKIAFIILFLFSFIVKGQSLIKMTGAEQITVSQGEILHIDGLTIQPSQTFSMTSVTINKPDAPANNILNGITRAYTFSNTLTDFSGVITFDYEDGNLNSLSENDLLFHYYNDGWISPGPGAFSQNITTNQYSATLSNASFSEITLALVQRIKPTISDFTDLTLSYGTDNVSATYTSTSTGTPTFTISNTTVAEIDLNSGSITTVGVGTTTLWLSLEDDGTYEAATASLTLTIVSSVLTITAEDKTKVYDGASYTPAASYTVSYTGFVKNQNNTSLTGTLTYTGTALTATNSGTYDITPGGLTSSNYSITFVSGVLSITQKPITIAITDQTKIYGVSDPSPLNAHTISVGSVYGQTPTGVFTRTLGEDVGTYTISEGNLTYGSNYIETFINGELTITARTITVTAAAKTKVFGESDPELTYTSTPVVGDPVVSGSSETVSFTGSLTRTAGENAGTYSITLGTLSNTNYSINYVGADFSITKAPTAISDGGSATLSDTTITFGDADLLLTPTSSNTGDYTFTSSDSSVASITTTSTNTASIRNMGVGSAVITISQAADPNYQAKTVSYTLTVNRLPVTVIPTTTQSKTYGEADLTLTYTTTPALSSSLNNSSTVTFTGTLSKTAGTNVGTYSITIGTLTNTNYALTFTETDYTINQRPITISAEAKTKVYGSADPSLTYTLTAGSIVGGDSVSGVLSRTSGEAAGTYTITQNTLTYGDNYDETYQEEYLSITNATVTLTVTDYTKIYDSQFIDSSNLSFTATGLVNGDTINDLIGTPTYTVAGTATNTVGTYSITLSGLSHPSYNVVFVGANATITPATLTITANTLSKTYGDADPALIHTTTGLISGDTFTGTLTRTAGENVGTYTISNNDLTYGNNYTENFVSGTLTITTKAITVTANAQTKVHGDVDPELTYTVSPAINTTLANNSSTITFTGSLSRTLGEDVGSYTIGIGTLTNTNFDVTFTAANLDITRLPVTITPIATQSKTYGDSDFTLAYTASPAVGSTLTNNTSTVTFTGTLSRTTGENVGTYSITIGTLTNTNYDITLSPETFAINKKTITVSSITASDKVYDANTNASVDLSGITFAGKETGDTITATVTGTFDTKDIGTAKTVSLSATYSSSALDNYTIVDQTTTTASITAKTVSVTGNTGINKTYDDTTNLPLGELGYGNLTGVLAGEDVYLTGVGVYDAATEGLRFVEIGTITLTGADKGNYTLNWTNGSGTISKKTLTVTANNDAKFITTPDAPGYNGVSFSGFEGDDSISDIDISNLVITRTNSSVNDAGFYTSTLMPSGVVAVNYDLSYVAGDYTIIPADKLLLTVSNQTTTYGSTATYTITTAKYYNTSSGVVTLAVPTPMAGVYPFNDGASTINIEILPSEAVNSTAGKLAVGSYNLNANVVFGSSGNFSNNIEVTGNHSVAKKPITASASGVSKEYDATTAMNGVSLGLNGLETADVVTVNGTGSFSSPNAGTGLSYTIAGLSLAGADADNYYLSAGASFSGTNGVIIKAPLTVTANNDNGVDTDPAYSGGNGVTYQGFKGSDGVSDLGGTLSYTGTSQGATSAGSYTIVPGGLTSSNYSITFVAGTLTIIVGDSDGDGVRDPLDNCPTTPNADQADADGDGIGDVCDNAPNTPNADQADSDGDGTPNVLDEDDDNDGVPDSQDAFPTDPNETTDSDGDGQGDNVDLDLDNDGVLNSVDNCPSTANSDQLDTDADGTGNACDNDDDNDGYSDADEIACGSDPLLASSIPLDTDADGIPNCLDEDDDNDGYIDVDELGCDCACEDTAKSDYSYANSDPLDATSVPADEDQDGIPDCFDEDKDNDGVLDADDAFPLDKNEWTDSDSDEIGNNADEDDDNDGQSDTDEIACGSDPLDNSSLSLDYDQDGIPNCVDEDSDNDGVLNSSDAFPLDPAEWIDTDADGIGNNADEDDDNDGYSDLDELECNSNPLDVDDLPGDLDQDGIPDCLDNDLDGDGCINTGDVFPRDPSECSDEDGDGLGNNVDVDDDNDGVIDSDDAFPLDPSETKDSDGDGIGDNADLDDNNDGFDDEKVVISGLITPNSSGLERFWKIVNIEQYPTSRVAVYNKNGLEVFSALNYQNNWAGTYQKSGTPLPEGSYLFRLVLGDGSIAKEGWIYIKY